MHRRDRAHIRGKVNHEFRLGCAKQIERAIEVAARLADARHGHPPAIPVLRKPGLLAELLAPEQRLGGGIQFVPLALELADTDVHIRRSAHDRATLLARELQRLLVRAHGIAETTLRDAYICQRDGAADRS